MSKDFNTEWIDHQNAFLELMFKDVEWVDKGLKRTLEGLIEDYRPRKESKFERLKSFFGVAKPTRDESRNARLFNLFQCLKHEIYGSGGRSVYAADREAYVQECKGKISRGETISIFVDDFVTAAADPRKSKRFMDYFQDMTFVSAKERVLKKLCQFDARQSFEYERIAGMWKVDLKDHLPVDPFQGFNETLGFAALDKLFADAGGCTTVIPTGTRCSHAGVLNKKLDLDDGIPCWTTTDPNKAINYAGTAVSRHVNERVADAVPQIIRGVVKGDLRCGLMHGTSFDQFTKDFCGASHAHLKAWIASWCAEPGRNFDGLVGTNGGADELVIMKPCSNVVWTPWITLPTTQAGFDRKYGNPPSLTYIAPTPTPQQPPSAPTPIP